VQEWKRVEEWERKSETGKQMKKRGEDIGAVERIRGLIVKRQKEGTKEE